MGQGVVCLRAFTDRTISSDRRERWMTRLRHNASNISTSNESSNGNGTARGPKTALAVDLSSGGKKRGKLYLSVRISKREYHQRPL